MPRNASGIYTTPAGTTAVSGQTISSTAYNNFLNDISQAITQSLPVNGVVAMTGNLNMGNYRVTNLLSPPQAPQDAVPQLYVDSQSQFGGFQNRIHNGNLDVWQRGAGPFAVATNSYLWTADGWIVSNGATGATVNVQNTTGRFLTYYSLQLTGAAGVTAVTVTTRIEAADAVALQTRVCTFQAWIYNGTGLAFIPALQVQYANAVNNFSGGVTSIISANLQNCAAGVWTQVAYAFTPPTQAANGLQVSIAFPSGALAVSGYIARIAEVDLRPTPNVTNNALVTLPPPFEKRPVAVEYAYCQRYYEMSLNNAGSFTAAGQQQVFITGLASAANNGGVATQFKVTKSGVPTVFVFSPITAAANKVRDNVSNVDVTPTVSNIGSQGFFWYAAMNVAGTQVNLTAHWSCYVPDLGGG